MEPYREKKILGNEILPLQVYKIDMNQKSNCEIITEVVSGFGTEKIKKVYPYPTLLPHWHSYVEILYFTEGSAIVQLNNEYFEVNAGQIILVDAFDIHSLKGKNKHIVLLIDLEKMSHLEKNQSNLFSMTSLEKWIGKKENEKEILENTAKNIRNILQAYENKTMGYPLKITASLYDIFSELLEYKTNSGFTAPSDLSLRKQNLQKLQILFEYINQNYAAPITLKDASQILGFSPSYFCRFFKSSMGKPFFEYLNHYRCAKAEILLNTSDKTITEVALETGFSSVSYFNKVYKKTKGYAPSKERINK